MTGHQAAGVSSAAPGTSSSSGAPALAAGAKAGSAEAAAAAAAIRPPGAADELGVVNEVDWSGQSSSSSGAAGLKGSAESDWGLWYIHGRAYDLTGFMDQHPGA